ncbi:LytS/YhcK type 5TM receptor domain-containing protein, partial [Nostoc sp. NIES-2111]
MADVDLIIRFVSCMSVLVVAAAALGILDGWLTAHRRVRGLAIGLVLGCVGMLSMADPVRTSGGLFFDARHVVVMLSAPVGGPVATVVATAMLGAMRWTIGGPVATVALIAIGASAVTSVLWWARFGTLRTRRAAHALALLAAFVPTSVSLGLLLLEDHVPGAALRTIGWSVLFNALGLQMIGLLLLWHRERGESLMAFRRSEERLDSIARNARGALFRLRLDRKGNPDLLQLSHAFPPFAAGEGPGLHVPGSRDDIVAFREVLETSAARQAPFVFERSYALDGGATVWVRWQAAPQRQPDGTTVWDGFVSDVTDRMQVKLRLERERQQVLEHMLREFEGRVASAVRVFAASSERLRDGASTMQ